MHSHTLFFPSHFFLPGPLSPNVYIMKELQSCHAHVSTAGAEHCLITCVDKKPRARALKDLRLSQAQSKYENLFHVAALAPEECDPNG